MSREEAPGKGAAGGKIVSKDSSSTGGGARKGRTDSLSEAQRRPVTGTRSDALSPPRMVDQLAAPKKKKHRRFPSRAATAAGAAEGAITPPHGPPATQRYDAIAPPHRAGAFERASSSPEEPVWRRQAEPPDLFGRLSSTPARFQSSQEEVKVMQQSAGKAWVILGRRFHAAHSHQPQQDKDEPHDDAAPVARTSHTTLERARRSAAPGAPQREGRRSSASHAPS
ncbi:hypothetical protein T484DRAFT_1835270, partial [Baffinella frigidus]